MSLHPARFRCEPATVSAGASSMITTAPAFEFDFFISRRGTVAAEAQEVADILQSEGYRVLVQDYDAALGESFPLFIHDALTKARHLRLCCTPPATTARTGRGRSSRTSSPPPTPARPNAASACCAAMPPARAGCSPAWSTAT